MEKHISDEMKLKINREIAISYFKEKNYRECLYYLLNIINSNNINNLIKNRTILDYCYAFKKLFITENIDNIKEIYISIKEKINFLNQIMEKPIKRDIYYETYYLRNEIFYLLSPDIVMLNSNPLINISNYSYSLNNQYFILNELNSKINRHIRIDTKILNNENLKEALNKKGEILIIQSDDFMEEENNKCIICESEKGKSYKLYFEDLIKIIKNKEINFKIIILCFPKSYLLKEYFDDKNILYSYIIFFDNIDFSKKDIMNKYNNICIQFVIDFIKYSVENDNVENIFNLSKIQFTKNINELKSKLINDNNIKLVKKNQNVSKIEYHREINENKIYLYNPLPQIDNINILENVPIDYSLKVFNLIEKINKEKNAIFYCDKSNKSIYLNLSIEAMKYFHRHKTYCETFYIDIKNGDKNLLKSIIRKLNTSIIKEEVKSEYDENENEENIIKQKACFILINNCNKLDLLDINIYSILNNDSSFIIIYDNDNNEENKENKENKIKEIILLNKDKIEHEELTVFFIRYGSNNLEIIDENFIKTNFDEKYSKGEEENYINECKSYIINKKTEVFQNGNLIQYIRNINPLKEKEDELPFKEDEARLLFYKIIKMVEKLHDNKICHLDLKIQNIMLDKNYNPILLNFGTSKKYGEKIDSSNLELNEYSPPELYSENIKLDGFKIDIFSLGIALFTLIFGQLPFTKPLSKCKFYEYIKQHKYEEFWKSRLYDQNLEITNEFKKLFINMVTYVPNTRFSIKEVINSNWMNKIIKMIDEKSKEFDNVEKELYNNFNNKSKFMMDEKNKIYLSDYEKQTKEKKGIIERMSSYKEHFNSLLKPKIENEDDKFNNIIKINKYIEPNGLMDELYNNLTKKFDDNLLIIISEDELMMSLIFENGNEEKEEEEGEEKEEEELNYSIQLYENKNKGYNFLSINYLKGNLNTFYEGIEELKQLLKNK